MAAIHRMTSNEHRAWRNNIAQLVRFEGEDLHVERALAIAEEEAIDAAVRIAKKRNADVSKKVTVASDPRKPGEKRSIDIDVKVQQTPDGGVRATVMVDGCERKTAREVISWRLLKKYGRDVQLRRPNQTFCAMIRDPKQFRPVAADANRTAPHPDACSCKDWGNPHPGRHHQACPHNVNAPPDEQALTQIDTGGTPTHENTTPEDVASASADIASDVMAPEPDMQGVRLPAASSTRTVSLDSPAAPRVETAVEEQDDSAPDPADCVCKDWAGTEPGKHHQVCQFRAQWEKEQAMKAETPIYWLYDMTERTRVREALPEEVKEAIDNQIKTQVPTCTVNEQTYLVLSADEAPPEPDPEDREDDEPQPEETPHETTDTDPAPANPSAG